MTNMLDVIFYKLQDPELTSYTIKIKLNIFYSYIDLTMFRAEINKLFDKHNVSNFKILDKQYTPWEYYVKFETEEDYVYAKLALQ